MIKEQCEHCHNMVVGQFSPSDTRKWLTTLAKKGGMKAVLTAAGTAIPGFGNVTGFLAGAAIDVIYGKDINKLVDKVADAFDDNKVYVFTCPNCGHTWTRKEDDLVYSQVDEEESDEMATQFEQALSYFLDNTNQVIKSAESTSDFMTQMNESAKNSSSYISAAFHFLAALAGVFFLKDSTYDSDEYRQIRWRGHSQIKQAISLHNTTEYHLIELLLQIQTNTIVGELPKYIRKAAVYNINEDSWLKKEYYKESLIPDICFWKVFDIDKNDAISNEDKIAVWKALVNTPVRDFRMYANLQIYWKLVDSDKSAHVFLSTAFNTEGFSLYKPDLENVMYEQWLWAAEEYAECLYSGLSDYIGNNQDKGLYISRCQHFNLPQ